MDRTHAMAKCPYICGPLTELPKRQQDAVKRLYIRLADVCKSTIGVRAFVPHEYYDPVLHAHFTPRDVDTFERKQICEKTSLLIVVAVAPTWGGGIEVEMANNHKVPAIILCNKTKLKNRRISRLLRGNGAIKQVIAFTSHNDAVRQLITYLQNTGYQLVA